MTNIPALVPFEKGSNPYVRVLSGGYVLSNLQTVLSVAHKNRFGVIAINQRSPYIVTASLEAAWQEHSPVILECAESETEYCNMAPDRMSNLVHDGIEAMIKKYGYTVPVVVHQDHVQKDLTLIDRAAQAGFSSCEVDLSRLPLDENITRSAEIVKKMHPLGISVEVEEGEIGFAESLKDPDHEQQYFTQVEDAVKLVEATRPDALAIFVGNGHGNYVSAPKIGYDRIREIADAVASYDVYVVLHGGSGLPPSEFNKAVNSGAAKFNYATSVSDILFKHFTPEVKAEMEKVAKEMNRPLRKVLKFVEPKIDAMDKAILQVAMNEMTEHIRMMMRDAFYSNGKAELYK
ncbi:class II fructose-bisphosphate aldolase [Candidatus Peregrinibacteria bacterium]|nr:class II fructose-bisphosphate aldolase [Candidatus Peregrinibacteria bacterium]